MADGVCPKCGWKAPSGLLKCPFCKTYIREPGAGSSHDEKAVKPIAPAPPPLDPKLPPPDPTVVRRVQRELARELFDASDKWPVFEGDAPASGTSPDETTDPPVR
jgi:hypothetical protein